MTDTQRLDALAQMHTDLEDWETAAALRRLGKLERVLEAGDIVTGVHLDGGYGASLGRRAYGVGASRLAALLALADALGEEGM
jgi:hypothetical protein